MHPHSRRSLVSPLLLEESTHLARNPFAVRPDLTNHESSKTNLTRLFPLHKPWSSFFIRMSSGVLCVSKVIVSPPPLSTGRQTLRAESRQTRVALRRPQVADRRPRVALRRPRGDPVLTLPITPLWRPTLACFLRRALIQGCPGQPSSFSGSISPVPVHSRRP